MIDILYRQTFVWIGSTFCPWLPTIACLAQVTMFLSLKHSMLNGGYERPDEPWSAEQTFKVFMIMALLTLLVTMGPVLIWLNTYPNCGPHCHPTVCPLNNDLDISEIDLAQYQTYKVYETLGSFFSETVDKESTFNSELVLDVISVLLNPPSLIILILVMWARFRFVSTELEATKHEIDRLRTKYDKENRFLSDQLEDVTKKHEGDTAVARVQKQLDRTMQGMEQKELDGIVSGMDKSAEKFFDQDGDGTTSSMELQVFVDLAAQVDADDDDHISDGEDEAWHKLVMANTIWIGNIDSRYCTEKYVQQVCNHRFGTVIAATCKKYSDREAKKLSASPQVGTYGEDGFQPAGIYANKPELLTMYEQRSWAVVTFANKNAVQFADDVDMGQWEANWDAEAWSKVAAWELGDMTGKIGTLSSSSRAAETIKRHNNKLHEALDAALTLKKKVDKFRKGLYDDDDGDDEVDLIEDDDIE
eukprot:SAG11_NODE_1192_length_5564_cov_1.990851_3_plen_474_part_00